MKNIIGVLLLPLLVIILPLAFIVGGIYYYVRYTKRK